MIFQRVLKGICAKNGSQPGMTEAEVNRALAGHGIYSNWWRNRRRISPPEVAEKLTEEALIDHLTDYERVRDTTPFISTTAGTVEVEREEEEPVRNIPFPPLYTALRFATDNFTRSGYLFYAYLFVLGRKSVELEEFSEEVRDVNLYTKFYSWHLEGEVMAKVHIPARCIEKAELYSHTGLERTLEEERVPAPDKVFSEPLVYRDPWRYANVRGFPET